MTGAARVPLPMQEAGLPPRLAAAVAPLRPLVLGTAVGLLCGALFCLVTAAHLVVLPREAPHLELLAQYLPGYHVSVLGGLVGGSWGFVGGFVAGGLIAYARNGVVRLWLEFVRAKANLGNSEFLDGI